MKLFYVYMHMNAVTGAIFYIGCGDKARPYDIVHRTKLWKEAAKRGFDVAIIKVFGSKPEALAFEKTLIRQLSQEGLSNVTGTPEYKSKIKAIRNTLESKAKWKAISNTPEYKAKQKAAHNTPEYKAKWKATWSARSPEERAATHEKKMATTRANKLKQNLN